MVYLTAIIVLVAVVAIVIATTRRSRRGGTHRRTDVAAPGLVQAWRERRAGPSLPPAPGEQQHVRPDSGPDTMTG